MNQYRDEVIRPTMSESRFRVFEPLFKRALEEGVFVINPMDYGARGMKSGTFVMAFTDARKAFQRFKYKSKWIRADYPLEMIKATALVGERIRIMNRLIVENNWSRTEAASFAVMGKVEDALAPTEEELMSLTEEECPLDWLDAWKAVRETNNSSLEKARAFLAAQKVEEEKSHPLERGQ